jgi:F-type H+-transporting ATPase subunit b
MQWAQILFTILIINLLLYNPVKQFIAARTARIQDNLDTARQNNDEGSTAKANYEQFMHGVEKEREAIIAEAHRIAVEESEKVLTAAKEEAKQMRVNADLELSADVKGSSDDVKKQIFELSHLMASRFVEVSIDEKKQYQYVNEAVADWSGQ